MNLIIIIIIIFSVVIGAAFLMFVCKFFLSLAENVYNDSPKTQVIVISENAVSGDLDEMDIHEIISNLERHASALSIISQGSGHGGTSVHRSHTSLHRSQTSLHQSQASLHRSQTSLYRSQTSLDGRGRTQSNASLHSLGQRRMSQSSIGSGSFGAGHPYGDFHRISVLPEEIGDDGGITPHERMILLPSPREFPPSYEESQRRNESPGGRSRRTRQRTCSGTQTGVERYTDEAAVPQMRPPLGPSAPPLPTIMDGNGDPDAERSETSSGASLLLPQSRRSVDMTFHTSV